MRDAVLKFLKIRRGEAALVKDLFAMEFFQGAGIAFFFTAAFTLFLKEFPITELPKVFIISAFLLWLTGIFYTQLEHKLNVRNLGLVVTLFMAFNILLFRVGYELAGGSWFLYIMLAWFNVLYLMNSLQFWGMASLLFDVRQSKRLFAIISSGDIPAKFFGYTVASLVVVYTGTSNLLFAGFACMCLSIPFMLRITGKGAFEKIPHHAADHGKPATAKKIDALINNFTKNRLIIGLAILSFLATACLYIINYAFYAEVKEKYQDDVGLAKFVALFLAASRLIAILLKMVFTSRLIDKLGFKYLLLITPVLLCILVSVLLFSTHGLQNERMVFFMFGVIAILTDVFRSSIHSPVFLTLMQPLPTQERLRAHTIVKGIMDPFAFLVTGLLLLALIRFYGSADIVFLSYCLLGFALLWIIWIVKVNRIYLRTLIQSISTRFMGEAGIQLTDAQTLQSIREKMQNGTELENIYLLRMLEKQPTNDNINELIILGLKHNSDTVKKESIRIISERKIVAAGVDLQSIVNRQNEATVIGEAIKALCKLSFDETMLLSFIENEDPVISQAAIAGLLNCDSAVNRVAAENKLSKLTNSSLPDDRLAAIQVIAEINNSAFHDALVSLMDDADKRVSRAAIITAGMQDSYAVVSATLRHIDEEEKAVLNALSSAGSISIPLIHSFLLSGKCTPGQAAKLLKVCSYIGGAEANVMLYELLEKLPQHTALVIQSMYKCKFTAKDKQVARIETLINKSLARADEIIQMEHCLSPSIQQYEILLGSLQIELRSTRELLLRLFSFLYDKESLHKATLGFESRKKEFIGNAMELIDMAVAKHFANRFNSIFEYRYATDFLPAIKYAGRKIIVTKEHSFDHILQDPEKKFNHWTRSCCLYTGSRDAYIFRTELIRDYTKSSNPLLKETALYVLQTHTFEA
jgi:ATP:ADP antiporter, AAA family